MDEQPVKQAYNVLLMNCRHTVQLENVAAVFRSIQKKIPKLPLDIRIEKRYFEYGDQDAIHEEMQDAIYGNNRPENKPECACLVLSGNDPRLSINEASAAIGFYKVYSALKAITDDHVVIVVAKDPDYTDKKKLVSDKVVMKVSAQFTRHYLYGPIGYVFSWQSSHQPVHEETMLKFILPTEWEPHIDDLRPKEEPKSIGRSFRKKEAPSLKGYSMPSADEDETAAEKPKPLHIKKPSDFDSAERCSHNVLLNIKEYCTQLHNMDSRCKVTKILAWNGHDIDERFSETMKGLGLGDDEKVPEWLFNESKEILACKQNPTLIAFIKVNEKTNEIEIITKDIRNLESFNPNYDIFHKRYMTCVVL
ncbi:uncharacterized protein [Ptychodera flava]|uniref:uncharacterized protein n=1 Tax=Ptychodera flava TaxID=63121 RepID=UPI00396A6FC2